jgi:hypothetical protein
MYARTVSAPTPKHMNDILGLIIQFPGYAGIVIGFNKYAV